MTPALTEATLERVPWRTRARLLPQLEAAITTAGESLRAAQKELAGIREQAATANRRLETARTKTRRLQIKLTTATAELADLRRDIENAANALHRHHQAIQTARLEELRAADAASLAKAAAQESLDVLNPDQYRRLANYINTNTECKEHTKCPQ